MKKLFYIVAVALVSTGAFAQKLSYGVKAGLNFSTITGDEFFFTADDMYADKSMRIGFHAGLTGECRFNDFIGMQAELLYSQQGLRQTSKDSDGKSVTRFDYLNLPVMAKFYLIDGLSLEAGLQLGYLMSAKLKGADSGSSSTVNLLDYEYSYSDNFIRFDIAAAFGLSYKFVSGIEVSARYNLGLTRLSNTTYDGSNKKPVSKNNVMAIGLGYRF